MRTAATSVGPEAANVLKSIRVDERGTTAVEFALIAVPFIMLLMGIMSVCLYFFTTLYTENAVWSASRDLRTGALQQGTGSYGPVGGNALDDPAKLAALKKSFCDRTPSPGAECENRIRMMVQSFNPGDTVAPPSCRDQTNPSNIRPVADANNQFDPGGANQVVMVTACFPWKLGSSLPFLTIGNITDGGDQAFLVQASALFRSEPF